MFSEDSCGVATPFVFCSPWNLGEANGCSLCHEIPEVRRTEECLSVCLFVCNDLVRAASVLSALVGFVQKRQHWPNGDCVDCLMSAAYMDIAVSLGLPATCDIVVPVDAVG